MSSGSALWVIPDYEALFGERDRRALERLARRALAPRFKLAIIEVREPLEREAVLSHLRGVIAGKGGVIAGVDMGRLPGLNLWHELKERVDTSDLAHTVLALWGIEESEGGVDDERPPLFEQLNVQRDLFVRDLGCLWLLFLTPYASRRLQLVAPDFCDFALLWISVKDAERDILQGHRPALLSSPVMPAGFPKLKNQSHEGLYLLRDAWQAAGRLEEGKARRLLQLFAETVCRPSATTAVIAGLIEAMLLRNSAETHRREALIAQLLEQLEAGIDERCDRLVLRAELILEEVELCRDRGDAERALELLQQAHDIYQELGDRFSMAMTLHSMSVIYWMQNEESRRVRALTEAVSALQGLGGAGAAHRHRYLGLIKQSSGDVTGALREHKSAAKIWKSIGDRLRLARSLESIGYLKVSAGDLVAGICELKSAQRIYAELGAEQHDAVTSTEIASLLLSADPREAITHARRAVRLFDVHGNHRYLPWVQALLALALIRAGGLRAAETELRRAERGFVSLNDTVNLVLVKLHRARLRLQQGDAEQAQQLAETAWMLAQQQGIGDLIIASGLLYGQLLAQASDRARLQPLLQTLGLYVQAQGTEAQQRQLHALSSQLLPPQRLSG